MYVNRYVCIYVCMHMYLIFWHCIEIMKVHRANMYGNPNAGLIIQFCLEIQKVSLCMNCLQPWWWLKFQIIGTYATSYILWANLCRQYVTWYKLDIKLSSSSMASSKRVLKSPSTLRRPFLRGNSTEMLLTAFISFFKELPYNEGRLMRVVKSKYATNRQPQ